MFRPMLLFFALLLSSTNAWTPSNPQFQRSSLSLRLHPDQAAELAMLARAHSYPQIKEIQSAPMIVAEAPVRNKVFGGVRWCVDRITRRRAADHHHAMPTSPSQMLHP